MIKMGRYFLVFLFLFNFLNVSRAGDDDLSIKNRAKSELAKQKMFGGQYRSALKMFSEILKEHPGNSTILYYSADCHYYLGESDQALQFLEKAKASSKPFPDVFLLLGKIYQAAGETEKALLEFATFKSKASATELKESDVAVYVSQCNNAKALTLKPAEVKVENLGQKVNSKYDDKGPAITADGRKLFFNSRRPDGTDSPMDVEGDGKFFEFIFLTIWDTVKHVWSEADEVPGQVNQEKTHTACTGISPDGKQIFIYKNDMNNEKARGGDIFVSKVMNHKWRTPEPIGKPVNSTYWEGGACISPDGKTLYFTSERTGGFGHSDIWMVKRKTKTEWDKPVNLGPEVNSPYDEGGLFLAPDGKTLFFCSNGPNSMGSYDIFRTVNENGKWSVPENLGYPINTINRDGPLVLSANTRHAFISSDRPGGLGETDIYMIDLMNYDILQKDFKGKGDNLMSILAGSIRDGFEGKLVDGADISIFDESGEKVTSLVSGEAGDYLITLKGDKAYTIKVSKEGYTTTEEKVVLPLNKKGEIYKLEKQFLLNK